MIEENIKPSYLNEQVIIKDKRAYLLWAISLVIGFVRSVVATATIFIPIILFILFVIFIGFGFDIEAMASLMNGLLYQFLLFSISFTFFYCRYFSGKH